MLLALLRVPTSVFGKIFCNTLTLCALRYKHVRSSPNLALSVSQLLISDLNSTTGTRRIAMQIELVCPTCSCSFAAPPDSSFETVRARMWNEGPWYSLGDGNTFEDMIFSTLMERGAICCPQCGDPVSVTE